jgi:hypothetical protein
VVGGGTGAPSGGPPAGTTQALQLGINTTVPSGTTISDQVGNNPTSQPRTDPVCEAANCQGLPSGGPALIGTIIIIIKRP